MASRSSRRDFLVLVSAFREGGILRVLIDERSWLLVRKAGRVIPRL
jgi:hypothetical protein